MATTEASSATTSPVRPAEPGAPTPDGPDREFTIRARSQREQIIRHFLHNKVGMTGLAIFVFLLVFAFIGPLINPKDYQTLDQHSQSVPPGTDGYLFGSDATGRDL